MKIKHMVYSALLLLFGCSSNSTSSNVVPPSQEITGIYKLSSASGGYVYNSGAFLFDFATSITGTLIIGQEAWNETFVVDGAVYSKDGIYFINYSNGTVDGTIGINYQNGGGTYNFSIDGYNLNLTGSPNTTWTKVGKVPAAVKIQDYTLFYAGDPSASTITLPQQLNDANWSLKETVCEEAGYSLIPHSGEDIAAIRYSIMKTYSNESLYLWILEKSQTTICAYFSVREGSSLSPGVFAINDANIK